MELDEIIETLRKIIRSEGSPQERLVRVWGYLATVEMKAANDKENPVLDVKK